MEKQKNTTKVSATLSSHAGEAGDMGDVVCDLRDEAALLEEALSQMGTSSKTPFHSL